MYFSFVLSPRKKNPTCYKRWILIYKKHQCFLWWLDESKPTWDLKKSTVLWPPRPFCSIKNQTTHYSCRTWNSQTSEHWKPLGRSCLWKVFSLCLCWPVWTPNWKKEPCSLVLAPPCVVTLKTSQFLWPVHCASLHQSGSSGWQPSRHLQSFSPSIIFSVKETAGAVLTLLQLPLWSGSCESAEGDLGEVYPLKGERQENTSLSPPWIYYFRPFGGSLMLGNCHRETQREKKDQEESSVFTAASPIPRDNKLQPSADFIRA